MKQYLNSLYHQATALNHQNILELASVNAGARLLDLGCDDGSWTIQVAEKIGTKQVLGVEIVEERAQLAEKKGIEVLRIDLESKWPISSETIDVVHSNFVIEHLSNVDHFLSEIFRVLRPGGYVIVSTENGSSWHNIFASILGWQTFSSSCFSTKMKGMGNPLGLHRGEPEPNASQTHKVIFNYLGLVEFFGAYRFQNICVRGSGYHPLPAWIGKWDVRHAHFLTLRAQRPFASTGK